MKETNNKKQPWNHLLSFSLFFLSQPLRSARLLIYSMCHCSISYSCQQLVQSSASAVKNGSWTNRLRENESATEGHTHVHSQHTGTTCTFDIRQSGTVKVVDWIKTFYFTLFSVFFREMWSGVHFKYF